MPMTALSVNQEKICIKLKRSGNELHDFTQMVS